MPRAVGIVVPLVAALVGVAMLAGPAFAAVSAVDATGHRVTLDQPAERVVAFLGERL